MNTPAVAALLSRQVSPSQWTRSRRLSRRLLFLLALVYIALALYLRQVFLGTKSTHGRRQECSRCHNSTLGFEKVVVVSTRPSWRLDGLIEAANWTGIDLEAPAQPKWTNPEVDIFRRVGPAPEHQKIEGRGLAQCWLGHLNVIREILARGWFTSLIMEDDVDWDITIKDQLSLVAPLIQKVTNSTGLDISPYGDGWDLLWLGHCGETTPESGPVVSQMDESLPESPLYRNFDDTYSYFPPQLRIVHHTYRPICTYAYALTYNGASIIYQLALGGNELTVTAGLYTYCQNGHLRCVSVNPELFHHHKEAGVATSEISVVEGWEIDATPGDVTYTANIRHSARCNSRSQTLVTCQDPMLSQYSVR